MNDAVLSVGIIKSDDSNIGFIHTTFMDYFAAKLFIRWIKRPNELLNVNNQEYLLKEILIKSYFQLIRAFINLKLKHVAETDWFEESVKVYGKIAEILLTEEVSPLIGEKGSVFHIAVVEDNKNIVLFLLDSLKKYTVVLQKFLFIPDKDKRTALHTAVAEGNIYLTSFMLNSLKGHTDVLKKFSFILTKIKELQCI